MADPAADCLGRVMRDGPQLALGRSLLRADPSIARRCAIVVTHAIALPLPLEPWTRIATPPRTSWRPLRWNGSRSTPRTTPTRRRGAGAHRLERSMIPLATPPSKASRPAPAPARPQSQALAAGRRRLSHTCYSPPPPIRLAGREIPRRAAIQHGAAAITTVTDTEGALITGPRGRAGPQPQPFRRTVPVAAVIQRHRHRAASRRAASSHQPASSREPEKRCNPLIQVSPAGGALPQCR